MFVMVNILGIMFARPSDIHTLFLRRRAFSLIELLCALAIVGILFTIIVPVVGAARRSAEDVQCKSALRIWGMSIQHYVNDNDGSLPGPCWAVVQNTPKNNRQLPYFLVPYMEIPLRDDKLAGDLLCPGWRRERTEDSAPVWQLVRVPRLGGGRGVRPFGYPNDANEPTPLNYSTLDGVINPAAAIALRDVDAGVASNGGLPSAPVHGAHRNVLFFDWHVGEEGI